MKIIKKKKLHLIYKNIITFYLQSRMYFLCDAENTNREKNKRKKFSEAV